MKNLINIINPKVQQRFEELDIPNDEIFLVREKKKKKPHTFHTNNEFYFMEDETDEHNSKKHKLNIHIHQKESFY